MAIITVDKVSLAFGHHQLLDKVSFALEKNDKYGLIGRNGAGKSSFLKVIAGAHKADDGRIHYQEGLKIVYVAQEPELNDGNTIFQEVMSGLGNLTANLTDYYAALDQMASDYSEALLSKIERLQHELELHNGWTVKNLIDKTLSELGLDGHQIVGDLSGGVRKKVALAKALVVNPDILFLDEPTNHLDVFAIEWLEGVINNFPGAIVLITHDRRFLDNTVNKILELDRGSIRSYTGNFARYQELKERQLADEAKTNSEFDKFLAQEEVWIRKGIEARRTRNEGRVRRLQELRETRKNRRDHQGQVRLQIDSGQLSGKIVAEIEHLQVSFGERQIIRDFSAKILRGDKIGLIGGNGAGKSTLLKAILGELEPSSGKVKLGTKLEVAYFDQLRQQLDDDATIQDVVAQGQDYVFINGARKHIATYLEEFLFDPARFRSPVASLSGGERNRLLLARLFSQPANVLVLDEPTNDLDMDTLELLEELLANYPGTVFLVSHDREFLDNVVTQSWVFLGEGNILEFSGGYSDWFSYKDQYFAEFYAEKKPIENVANVDKSSKDSNLNKQTQQRNKLSYKEKTELEQLPDLLASLEAEQADLNLKLQDSQLYKDNPELATKYHARVAEIDELLLEKLARWEELENKVK
ncbi:ATP-binding cassette domain-containing protein [Aquella oligotrophica]|uniref:ATP-binding protein Uup n=1 Tax=Aquella oligotrophica TaxID=2067065 RepID=A0A2I7N7P1_9NEIS|nr:ATP-binding cassette domain-containing protein [Aquella oligotrophica]AUR52452.1 ABC transporter ATP-binding protein [Aquella oligotrophica]